MNRALHELLCRFISFTSALGWDGMSRYRVMLPPIHLVVDGALTTHSLLDELCVCLIAS